MSRISDKQRKMLASISPGRAKPFSIRTQLDLAKAAGVGPSTVYNALHNKDVVHPKTLELIHRLMKEHDYHPDSLAQSMVLRKTNVIGVVVPSLDNPYYARFVSCVERLSTEANYQCIVCQHFDNESKEEIGVTKMRQRRVDGVIIRNCGTRRDSDFFRRINGFGIPIVLFDGRADGFDESFIGGDDKAAAFEAVSYLIKAGHRRIAHLGFYRGKVFQKSPRYAGYREALISAGLLLDNKLTSQCTSEYNSGHDEILALLKRNRGNPPTAVFCFNDNTALGVIEGARKIGLEIPKDLAVIGFGGYYDKIRMPMPLTSMVQDLEGMAKEAVEMLLAKIARKPHEKGPILVPSKLRIGKST